MEEIMVMEEIMPIIMEEIMVMEEIMPIIIM